MSTTYDDRWYIVPAETVTEAGEDVTRPKYSDRTGITGFSGTVVGRSVLSNYAGLLQTYPDIDDWYLVRLYGEWSTLNDISVLGDTRNLATNPEDVAAVLNQRLTGPDRSASAWAQSFRIDRPES